MDDEGFVTVADGLVIDGLLIETVRESGNDGVDRNHEQDSHNLALLSRLVDNWLQRRFR